MKKYKAKQHSTEDQPHLLIDGGITARGPYAEKAFNIAAG